MCELLVGLPEVNVLGIDDEHDAPIMVHVETRGTPPICRSCGAFGWVKDRPVVVLVDLPCFGRPARLVWHKHRWRCPNAGCAAGSWTAMNARIAPTRAVMTDRAGRWVTAQVGRLGRTVNEIARELGCDWHTVNDAVIAYGTPLIDDAGRIGAVSALGLDETLFCRRGARRIQSWCTSIVDVSADRDEAQLLDVVAGRGASAPTAWLEARPAPWRDAIDYGALDLSGPYRKTFDDALPDAAQVADPFHVVKHGNHQLDVCRRRVQNETLGHRGRRDDPLYRARRLLTKAHERLDEKGENKLTGLLTAGDPHGEVRTAWHAKELVRSICDITDADVAREFVAQIADDLQDESCPEEVQSLGRTLSRWFDQITAWHKAFVSNGPTEAINNLIKRIKRIGFGFRHFEHYRIRVLLYAGRPNWALLATVTPR